MRSEIHLFDRKMFSNNSDSLRPHFGLETIIQRSNVAGSFFADSTVFNLRLNIDELKITSRVKSGSRWVKHDPF